MTLDGQPSAGGVKGQRSIMGFFGAKPAGKPMGKENDSTTQARTAPAGKSEAEPKPEDPTALKRKVGEKAKTDGPAKKQKVAPEAPLAEPKAATVAADEDENPAPAEKAKKAPRIILDDEDEDDMAVEAAPAEAAGAAAKGKPSAVTPTRAAPATTCPDSTEGAAADATTAEEATADASAVEDDADADEEEAGEEGGDDDEEDVDSDEEEEEEEDDAPRKPVKKAKRPSSKKLNHASYVARLTKGRDPTESAGWKSGEAVPYGELTAIFEGIEEISGRLEIQELLVTFLRQVIAFTPGDLDKAIYLACNKVAPAFENVELGIGDSLIMKAITEATGRTLKAVKDELKRLGDLGLVAAASRSTQRMLGFGAKPKASTISGILGKLRAIAQMSGNQSQTRKVGEMKRMLVSAQGHEAKYIVRALQGKLRIGLAERTVIVALAHAAALSQHLLPEAEPAAAEDDSLLPAAAALRGGVDASGNALAAERVCELSAEVVKQAFSECPSYTELCAALLAGPLWALQRRCHLRPGLPVAPMLAKPTKAITEVLERLSGQAFTAELKYDGERAQIHLLEDGSVCVFSRNSENTSEKYPELGGIVKEAIAAGGGKATSLVVDSEVVAYDREKGVLLPFQVLSTRKKKGDQVEDLKVQVIIQSFDLLYLNGASMLHASLRERRRRLREVLGEVPGRFVHAAGRDFEEDGDSSGLEAFLDEAVAAQTEGLMVKTLDGEGSAYEPSKRSLNWLKLKKDYLDGAGVADSLDLAVVGGYHGHGKRTGVFGAYLLACYDPELEQFQSVCKLGTGFSDEDLKALQAASEEHHVGARPANVVAGDGVTPDVWFAPEMVWEVRAADLSLSSTHKGALGRVEPGRGIGLRFPRFIRVRDDKAPENATSAEQVLDFYMSQDTVKGTATAARDDADDDGFL